MQRGEATEDGRPTWPLHHPDVATAVILRQERASFGG